jgi:FtsH ternary system domain X7
VLEPISLGQGRTHCPGLAADERGVVLGRKLALFFPDVARAVGFFRSYSREVSLDEILSSLEIKEAISERGGREILVMFECATSYAGDRAAQAARMHRGRAFTGSEQHFVPFRDRRSPLGYDLAGPEDLVADPGDMVLYNEGGPDRRRYGRALKLADLILGLSPRPLSEAEKAKEATERLVVRCEQGLARSLCRYLWSRQVQATVTSATSAKKSLFSAGRQGPRELQLVTCEGMPKHIAHLLQRTPGLRVFVPYQPHLLVEWGFRHPIALESVGAVFSTDETVLFFGPPEKVERLLVGEEAVAISDIVDVTVHGRDGVIAPPAEAAAQPIDALDVELKLARVPRSSAATTALLIERERLPWFQKLIYMLPAAILRSYEAVLTEQYIIVINRRGVHGIPFGVPMAETYPQLFLPVGMQLLPRVDYDLLREHLQIRPDQQLYFFPEGEPPFSVGADQLQPLSRAVVAPERAKASIIELRAEATAQLVPPPSVAHKRQGVFSLWRGTAIATDAQLPPPKAKDTPRQLPAAEPRVEGEPKREDG